MGFSFWTLERISYFFFALTRIKGKGNTHTYKLLSQKIKKKWNETSILNTTIFFPFSKWVLLGLFSELLSIQLDIALFNMKS